MKKQCTKCESEKDEDCFHKNSRSKDGYCSYCKVCAKASLAEWKLKNPEKRKENQKNFYSRHKDDLECARKARALRDVTKSKLLRKKHSQTARYKRYGLTDLSFAQKLLQQYGKCALCMMTFDDKNTPQIDHNHVTGATRDLLCRSCNMRLGHFESNDFNRIASLYIEKHR